MSYDHRKDEWIRIAWQVMILHQNLNKIQHVCVNLIGMCCGFIVQRRLEWDFLFDWYLSTSYLTRRGLCTHHLNDRVSNAMMLNRYNATLSCIASITRCNIVCESIAKVTAYLSELVTSRWLIFITNMLSYSLISLCFLIFWTHWAALIWTDIYLLKYKVFFVKMFKMLPNFVVEIFCNFYIVKIKTF